ncbi:acyl transferase/acyl hydrolase/lysophospholipase [Mucor lusitanicus]
MPSTYKYKLDNESMLKTLLNSTITADMSVNDNIWVKPTLRSVTLKFMQPCLIFLENIYALIKCVIFLQHTTFRSTSYHNKDSYLEYFQKQLEGATSYKAWSQAAMALDNLTGANEWKNSPVSDDYDYKLLQSRIHEIDRIRSSGQDRRAMTFALRLSLSRNLGDMGNSALFGHCYVGTKKLISDYIDHIMEQLEWIGDTTTPTVDMDFKQRHDYFMNLRHSYGRTALLLSGGGTLGYFHIGVLKTLVNARLLPRILSGASTGSVMASIICTLNEQDRIAMLNDYDAIPVSTEAPDTLLLRLNRYLINGNLYDPVILKDALRNQYGDITFAEALLNHITAPDVVVWSAVILSCAVPLVYPDGYLYVKDKEGGLKQWTPTDDKYRDGSIDNDLPLKKISEMFSVNHFIVVQINPHVAPFLHRGKGKPSWLRTSINFVLRLVKEELQHRCSQLMEIGISSNAALRLQGVLNQRYVGDITLSPDLTFTDVGKILTNLTREEAVNFIQRGERRTWDNLSKIHHSLKIELAIDAAIYKLRKVLLGESPQIPQEFITTTPSLLVSPSSSLSTASSSSSASSSDHNSNHGYEYDEDDEEEEDNDSEAGYNDVSIPPTPLWQMDNVPFFITKADEKQQPRQESRLTRPSLLPHDISRRGSNVSIRDISPSTSMTRFERRKQITSAQFFIAPEFDWVPESKSPRGSKKKLSVAIPRKDDNKQ